MSKRKEMRDRRRREQALKRILTIAVVVGVALGMTFLLILPSLREARNSASATQTALNATPIPIIAITPQSFSVKVDGRHLGDPNAPVKVDAYEDFRCSACLAYTQTIEPQIIKDYVETGKIYYTYRIYLVVDSNDKTDASYRSANAALCAGDQNRFWDFHDTLYTNQVTESASLFTDDRLTGMARNLGLDMTAFDQCFRSGTHAGEIQADTNQAGAEGVHSTPSIFVDGALIQSWQRTAAAIDQALAGK